LLASIARMRPPEPSLASGAVLPDFPAIEVSTSNTPDAWTAHLRLPEGNRVALHSTRDPLTEARRQCAAVEAAAPSIVVLVGAGLGFATEAARERWPDARIVVLEPAPELARQARARTPALYASDRVHLVSGPRYDSEVPLWRLLDQQDGPEPPVIVHPVMARVAPHATAEAAACAKRAIHAAQMNARAREENAGRYLLNTLRNLASLANGADLSALHGRLSGVPIVVVAAGPSLDRQLPALRQFADRALVIAADTAWRPLVHAGIDPHLVVALDPTELNGRHLLNVPARRLPWLLAELSIDPHVPPSFQGRTGTFRVATHHPWPWLHTLGFDRPVVRVWGSVLTAAFDLALSFGGNPIVLAGADLAFTNGQPYCRGTTFEEAWARTAAQGWSLRRIWEAALASRQRIEAPDVNGTPTVTAPHLIEFRNWLVERSIDHPERRIVNSTGHGILAGGRIEQSTLESVLAQSPTRGSSIEVALDTALQVNVSSSLARRLRDAVEALEREAASVSRERVAGPLADWLAFGRPSLTLADIQAALGAARGALDEQLSASPTSHRGDRRQGNAALPDASLRMHPADRVARTRARLTGDLSGLDGTSTETAMTSQLPRDARLAAVHEAVMRVLNLGSPLATGVGEDVAAGVDPWVVPLSYRFAWTHAAAPLVAVVEEALLDASEGELPHTPGDSRAAESFWSKPVTPIDSDEQSGDEKTAGASGSEHSDAEARLSLVLEAVKVTTISQLPCSPKQRRILDAIARGLADPRLRLTAAETSRLRLHGHLALPLRIDALMRALTGTFVRAAGSLPAASISPVPSIVTAVPPDLELASTDDPRMIFLRDAAGWIEPDVLSDRGVPQGWICATIDDRQANLSPRVGSQGVLIDANGDCQSNVAWPADVTGEMPWGQAGGAVAWSRNTSQLWLRTSAGSTVVEETVPFRPFDMVLGPAGTMFWIGDTGGLWEWVPARSGRFIGDTPQGRLRLDGDGLIVYPVERDATNRLLWRPRTHAWRYDTASGRHERIDVGTEGQSGSVSRRGAWTARTFPFASRITLRHDDGLTIALACYVPFGVAWAGCSLLVTTMDGDVLLFRDLMRLLDDQITVRARADG
jgi:hypothetical protein